MNKNKLIYEAPEAETLVVRFEGSLLTGSDPQVSATMVKGGYDDYCDLDEE